MIGKKSIFSWNVPAVMKGDPVKFIQALVDAGFEAVCLKAADGDQVFKMAPGGPWPKWGENIKSELIAGLRAAGLKIYLWHFLYGGNPKGEMNTSILQCNKFKPDGYIWDAEAVFDARPNAVENARTVSRGLLNAHPEIPQALCWWALPKNPKNYNNEWHPVKVAKAFLETVDTVMPMMYWGGSSAMDAVSYLHSSLKIWKTITDRPLVPVGRAYSGDGGLMEPFAITAFAETVMELSEKMNLTGISWWSLDKAIQNSACWAALRSTEKFGVLLRYEEIIDRLMNAHPELFPEMVFNI
jgi:hypothetical protein